MAATVLVEYVKLGSGTDIGRDSDVLDSVAGPPELIEDIADEPVLSEGAPAWEPESKTRVERGYGRVTVLVGAIKMVWGRGDDLDPAGGVRRARGERPLMVALRQGEKIAFIEAETSGTSVEGAATEASLLQAVAAAEGLRDDFNELADVLPPRMRQGLVELVTDYPVDMGAAGVETILAGEEGFAYHMSSCLLSIEDATILTFAAGGVDLALKLKGHGVLDLPHFEAGYVRGVVDTDFTISSSEDVEISGKIFLQKRAVA